MIFRSSHKCWGFISLVSLGGTISFWGINVTREMLHLLNSSIHYCSNGKYFNRAPQTFSKNPMVEQRKWQWNARLLA